MSFESLVSVAEASVSDGELSEAYDGERKVGVMGLNVSSKTRALEISVDYPRLTVDTMAEVLTVEGFESAGTDDDVLEVLKSEWDRQNMAVLSYLAHAEALIQGEGYVLVGAREDGSIQTSVLARDGVAVLDDSEGRAVEAVVVYEVPNESGGTTRKAAYYTPDVVETWQSTSFGWGRIESQPGVGRVPLIPIRNTSRLGETHGRSEMYLTLRLADVASRAFTMLQVAMEILAMPQRWMSGADQSKMKDQYGNPVSPEQLYLGSFLMSPNPDTKMGQFNGANLDQIIAVIEVCAKQVSAMTGIPPSMLGVSTANPASAEAMRAAKERMISRGEMKQALFGDVWEQWAYLVLLFMGRSDEAGTINTVWRDVAVASVSAKAANLLQAHAQGVITARTARDGIQLTPEQKARENASDVYAGMLGTDDRVINNMLFEGESGLGSGADVGSSVV